MLRVTINQVYIEDKFLMSKRDYQTQAQLSHSLEIDYKIKVV